MSRYLLIAATLFAWALTTQPVQAGRIGGPASGFVTVPAYQSYYVDVPFQAGDAAVVSVVGDGMTDVGLVLYDGEGNAVVGDGLGARKTAMANVTRAGFFRVEVRNLGPIATTVLLGTN